MSAWSERGVAGEAEPLRHVGTSFPYPFEVSAVNPICRILSNAISKGKVCRLLLLFFVTRYCYGEQYCQRENTLASTPDSRFFVQQKGTVTDQKTGLMWKTCLEGISGENCNDGEYYLYNWAVALNYVGTMNELQGFAGFRDWRLPNIRELSTLVELQCVNPAINLALFPNAPAIQTWTSSPYHFYTHYSWLVDFALGAPSYDERIQEKSLRLVRDHN